tara:strand:+ start:647 stop:1063 length:417 start_codon:yes stop_codon:yes gene_type:complete
MDLTYRNVKIKKHITHNSGGTKTVCVSTCLSFFGIHPREYHYTSSKSNIFAYKNVMRKNGLSVRSRVTEFKVKKHVTTMSQLKRSMRASDYGAKDFFIVSGVQSKVAHLMVLDGNGNIIIDTARGKRWRIRAVSIVEK